MKFRKIPIEVEATQWFPGINILGVIGCNNEDYCEVTTIQGQHVKVSPGEWIITERDGIHHYPCDDKVFKSTYIELKGE